VGISVTTTANPTEPDMNPDHKTLSYDQWRERERRANRRSLIVWLIVAAAFTAALIYVRTP